MKCYLFALQRQCQIDKYFHHLAISDGLLRLIRHHWIIKENNAEGFKTNCCGKQRCTICDRWNKSRPFLMYMMFTITKWSCEDLLREKAILEPVLTFFSHSLLLSATFLLKEYVALLVYDVHVYLQHLKAMCAAFQQNECMVAQCAWIMLTVLYEEMRDFTLVTNWHLKYGPYMPHLVFSDICKGTHTSSAYGIFKTSQMCIIC